VAFMVLAYVDGAEKAVILQLTSPPPRHCG